MIIHSELFQISFSQHSIRLFASALNRLLNLIRIEHFSNYKGFTYILCRTVDLLEYGFTMLIAQPSLMSTRTIFIVSGAYYVNQIHYVSVCLSKILYEDTNNSLLLTFGLFFISTSFS